MRVLLVSSRFPWPSWRGNQVRTIQWLDAIAEHEACVVCPAAPESDAGEVAASINTFDATAGDRGRGLLRALLDGRPLQEGFYEGATARRTVAASVRRMKPDVVVIQMVRCAWALDAARDVAPGVPVIFDAIDSMGLHFERAAQSSSVWSRSVFRAEAARCRRRERWLGASANLTIAVARRDLAALAVPEGRGRVVPVASRVAEPGDPEGAGPVVLLSGNLGYRPTVQGALWFAREVWPQVRRRFPTARWMLAGARPASAVRRLAQLAGVEVHADVPDLGAYVRTSRVALAPMSSGSGVPMKVLESMAAGVPVLVHPWAADGLAAEAAGAVAVADGADAWVEALGRLLGDGAAARELGDCGHEAWHKHYHPNVVAEQIRAAVAEAASSRR